MKFIHYIIISWFIFCACNDDPSIVQTESEKLSNTFIINVNGVEESISFDCNNSPSLYSFGIRNDQSTNKYIFSQGYATIPFSEDIEFIYQVILYTDSDIRGFNSEELRKFIDENPEILNFEIAYKEEGKIYKNQFYSLSGLQTLYEERNIVAENEIIDYSLGNIKTIECADNNESIELDLQYSAVIKTKDELHEKSISLDLDFYLTPWK